MTQKIVIKDICLYNKYIICQLFIFNCIMTHHTIQERTDKKIKILKRTHNQTTAQLSSKIAVSMSKLFL